MHEITEEQLNLLMKIARKYRVSGTYAEDSEQEILIKLLEVYPRNPEPRYLHTVARNAKNDFLTRIRPENQKVAMEWEPESRAASTPTSPALNYNNKYMVLYHVGFTLPKLSKLCRRSTSWVWAKVHQEVRTA